LSAACEIQVCPISAMKGRGSNQANPSNQFAPCPTGARTKAFQTWQRGYVADRHCHLRPALWSRITWAAWSYLTRICGRARRRRQIYDIAIGDVFANGCDQAGSVPAPFSQIQPGRPSRT
jgi:hypothetical protein